jgi:hypothetical protein
MNFSHESSGSDDLRKFLSGDAGSDELREFIGKPSKPDKVQREGIDKIVDSIKKSLGAKNVKVDAKGLEVIAYDAKKPEDMLIKFCETMRQNGLETPDILNALILVLINVAACGAGADTADSGEVKDKGNQMCESTYDAIVQIIAEFGKTFRALREPKGD